MDQGLKFHEAFAMAIVELADSNYQEARKWALVASGAATTDEQQNRLCELVRQIPEPR